jgi:hypothetical protein
MKKMDDYAARMDDSRFSKYDKMIAPDNSENKVTIILTIGLIVLAMYMVGSFYLDMNKPVPPKYEYGLNITYDPQVSWYIVDYTNPNKTATNLTVDVSVPYGLNGEYIPVYKSASVTTEYPVNISYMPYDKSYEHVITVVINKPTGNFTYFYRSNPGDEEKIYNGVTKYINMVKGVTGVK